MTSQLSAKIGSIIDDNMSEAEVDFYKIHDPDVQMVFVVVNSLFKNYEDGEPVLVPYSISLIPASKRGKVETSKSSFALAMQNARMFEDGAAYLGLDPFNGDWTFFSQAGLIAEMGTKSAFTDEFGAIYDYFFLRTDVDPLDIVQGVAMNFSEKYLKKYLKHRSKLLYTPFKEVRSRQIWGVENALEMFVLQEILRRNLPIPMPQTLIFKDGGFHPCLYGAWTVFNSEDNSEVLSEVDFFFPDHKVALFCDGATHGRTKIKERDRNIDTMLHELGIRSVRISSQDILRNIDSAIDSVESALA